ncbi:MAG TPA: PilZ domain-containing protein [Polyangiaceae bacterium]|nr:PilZ domain-containing protein [Polyangiaceae bacterium]
MTDTDERRAQGAKRVGLETLVEICGNEPGIPAFEAEALDVSGRGMHVRTAYLPELGAPLVCRFEDQGREILVEGVVAWRQESGRGGEFGLQFTALDSGSVDALTQLCGAARADASSEREPEREPSNEPGARVRLHIEGLGSPMKARVRSGSQRQIQVGSNLEFLKVGRRLDIEDIEHGEKRSACIEGVSVAIDPQSRVPQLVVILRYDDAPETTPEPSVIDADAGMSEAPPMRVAQAPRAAPSRMQPREAATVDERVDSVSQAAEQELEEDEDAGEFRGKIGTLATQAGVAMQHTTSRLLKLGAHASAGVARLVRDTHARVSKGQQATSEEKPRRTTHIPPPPATSDARRLRPQSSSARHAEEEPAKTQASQRRRRLKQLASAGAAAGLLVTVSVIAMQGGSASPPGAERGAAVAAGAAEAPAAEPAAGKAAVPAANRAAGNGISADVPLFGPTPMATMEPAPLGPVPDQAVEAAPEREDLPTASRAGADRNETFAEEQPVTPERQRPSPTEVEPWGRGKVRTPIVHRLRLDAAGFALQGAITPTGFAVVIPERKIMESAESIAQRDKRIARVQTKNLGSGAQVTFQFRDGVPGYRVRLRKDYVEFLISAEEKSAAEESDSNSATSRRSSKAKAASNKADSKKDSSSRAKRRDD